MALYWHPYLAELLRQDYGNRLYIEGEVSLGNMPQLASFLVDHFQEYPRHLQWLQELHVQQLREVLSHEKINPGTNGSGL